MIFVCVSIHVRTTHIKIYTRAKYTTFSELQKAPSYFFLINYWLPK